MDEQIEVPGLMLKKDAKHYALEVKGNTMTDRGIMDGDIVVIREQCTADNDDIVVAVVEGEKASLYIYRRRGNAIVLSKANPAYEHRVYREDQVEIKGKLTGLIRTFD